MIRPVYYCDTFIGFSALIGDEWTPPTTYKQLMRAISEKQSEVLTYERRKDTRRLGADVGSVHMLAPALETRMAERRQLQVPRVREGAV